MELDDGDESFFFLQEELNAARSALEQRTRERDEVLEEIRDERRRRDDIEASRDGWEAVAMVNGARVNELLAELATLCASAGAKTCAWKQDEDAGDLWEGSCGVAWSLPDGTPKQNRMNFCPRCGGALAKAGEAK